MIAGLGPYAAMKDSGVEWLGEVPEHWAIVPLGRMGRLFKGNGGSKDDEAGSGVPCVRYGDLYTRHEFFITSTKACVTADRADAYTPIQLGDLLFAASGETIEDIGKSAVNLIESEARCGGDVLALRPSADVVPRFLGYAADSTPSRHQKARMGRGFTVVHIYGSQLKRLVLCIPPLAEQAAIVRFLDHADRRIQRYIRAKQQLIKLLEEQRQAIIHGAVTRGLDPNVRLKPSGVKWLGDVPEHWEVLPLARIGELSRGRGGSKADEEASGVPCVRYGDLYTRHEFFVRQARSYVSHDRAAAYASIRQGDVLFAASGETLEEIGKSAVNLLSGPAVCGGDVIVLRLNRGVDSRFLGYACDAPAARDQKATMCRGFTIIHIYASNLKRLALAVPPVDEQAAIGTHLDAQSARITASIDGTRREIALLREYRTRLIADVVTGKLDVREAAARLPDEPEPLGDDAAPLDPADPDDDLDPDLAEAAA